jgi:hypothetical protein
VLLFRSTVILARLSVILDILYAKGGFQTQVVISRLTRLIFKRRVWLLLTECDYYTHGCDFCMHNCDFYTQNVVFTSINVIFTSISLISTREV